ncbi:catalase [Nocardioides agariphilus]|jgi:catalase|uniref:Catalase n=1 Tax=Nocardioides agariphilus TaxID=433664 RepID=A0A930VRP4_9ACTN|nr:catalase [Nocardioides agariphilus]MBF4768700.1 catalase [Nocardioides agariphilus]
MLPPEEAIDRLAAVMKAEPGHRTLHAKGVFCSGTFNASPDARPLSRALHLQGDTIPVLVRWSHGSGRHDANDNRPYVRGMSVSFVLPDGTSTDILGQTVPRFPVRTPDDFVRLTEVARDRRALLRFLATRPSTAIALAYNARVKALKPPRSYAEATYYPIHAYLWESLAGHGTWVRYRLVPKATPHDRPEGRFSGRDRLREELAARLAQGPVRYDLVVTVAGAKDDPHDPMSVWRGSREFVAGWFEITTIEEDREKQGDIVVFDPTRIVDGIELSDDPILRYRPAAYSVSIERRSRPHP